MSSDMNEECEGEALAKDEHLAAIWAAIDADEPYGETYGATLFELSEGITFRFVGGSGDDEWHEFDPTEDYGEDLMARVEVRANEQDAQEALQELPLEIVWEKGEPFAVVLGVGGPHSEITGGGRASGSGYELTVYWGGDKYVHRSEAITRTGEYFRDLVEQID